VLTTFRKEQNSATDQDKQHWNWDRKSISWM